MRRILASLLAAALAGAACGSGAPATDLPVETLPDQGRAHIGPEEPDPDYNSDPPTSGPHAPEWAPCGVYRQEIPDRHQVHSLEHGAVVVQYDPQAVGEEEMRRLEELGRRLGDHVIVAPRSGLEVAVAVTAWTKLMELDRVDAAAIEEFHRAFGGAGPERVGCPFQVDEGGG